jgi:hypothetical protein
MLALHSILLPVPDVNVFWLNYDWSTILFSYASAPQIHKVKASPKNYGKAEFGAIKIEEENVFAKKPQIGILSQLTFHFQLQNMFYVYSTLSKYYYKSWPSAQYIID